MMIIRSLMKCNAILQTILISSTSSGQSLRNVLKTDLEALRAILKRDPWWMTKHCIVIEALEGQLLGP